MATSATTAAADSRIGDGTTTTCMTPWAELDPGETREERFEQVGTVDLDISGDAEEQDENADEESTEVHAYMASAVHT